MLPLVKTIKSSLEDDGIESEKATTLANHIFCKLVVTGWVSDPTGWAKPVEEREKLEDLIHPDLDIAWVGKHVNYTTECSYCGYPMIKGEFALFKQGGDKPFCCASCLEKG